MKKSKKNSKENIYDGVTNSEEANAKGANYFANKKYSKALKLFNRAIEIKTELISNERLSAFYSNKSNCYLKLNELDQSISSAGEAIELNKSWSRGYIRKAHALGQKNESIEARKVLEEGLKYCSDKKEILDQIKLIDDILSENVRKTENYFKKEKKDSEAPADLNDLVTKLSTNLGLVKEVDVENFHLEYKKAFPKEEENFVKLNELHKCVKAEGLREFSISKDKDSFITPSYFLKRFGYADISFIKKIYENYKPGDIIKETNDIKKKKFNYVVNRKFHSFSNIPLKGLTLNYGKTYINIGFVDLSFLLNCVLSFSSVFNAKTDSELVKFYAIESCPFAVAKSLVIYKMLEEQMNSTSIAEVWFSSGWSLDTEKDFIYASKLVLESEFLKKTDNSDLKTILTAWTDTSITLEQSLEKWKAELNWFSHDCYNFKTKRDRVEVAFYISSGQIKTQKNIQNIKNIKNTDLKVGSRVMFVNPLKNYSKFEDENFLYCQDLDSVTYNEEESFLESVCHNIITRIDSAKLFISNKQIKVEFWYKEILPTDEETLKRIKCLNPWCIIWTNLCDYFSKEDFLGMAKMMSTEDTIHSIHSMNWVQEVYGIDVYDYNLNVREKLIEFCKDSIDTITNACYKFGIYKHLKSYSSSNIQNTVQYVMSKNYFDNWVNYYFNGCNTSEILQIVFSNLVQSSSIIFFSFCFNKEIKLTVKLINK